MRIFNQEVDGPDTVVSDFIQELLNSPEAKARAHGCNLQHDPRVSKDRATRFWTEIAKAKAATPSKKFSEFAFKHVQSASTPDFLNADNDGNAVANPPQNFVTILNINGLWRMFKWAQENNKDGFKTFEATPDKLKSGIQSRMQSDKRETFLPRVFGLHAEYSQANPYHPVWLACPDDLSCCQGVPVPQKASRLCERVGVSSEEKGGEWVVLLIFSSNKVKRVYRPTCLDSVTEYHFPTPEGDDHCNGGIGIDLNPTVPEPLRVREFIAEYPVMAEADFDPNQCFELLGYSCSSPSLGQEGSLRKASNDFCGSN